MYVFCLAFNISNLNYLYNLLSCHSVVNLTPQFTLNPWFRTYIFRLCNFGNQILFYIYLLFHSSIIFSYKKLQKPQQVEFWYLELWDFTEIIPYREVAWQLFLYIFSNQRPHNPKAQFVQKCVCIWYWIKPKLVNKVQAKITKEFSWSYARKFITFWTGSANKMAYVAFEITKRRQLKVLRNKNIFL